MSGITWGLIRAVRLQRKLSYRLNALNRVHWGNDFVVGPRARTARRASLRAGDRVNIGSDFSNHCDVSIGDDVMISSCVSVISDDHPFDGSSRTIQDFPPRGVSSVVLEGDNLIGYGTIIIGPVRIGRGAIIGAGSLVTRDVPEDAVAYGRPAVARRQRRPRQ